MTAPRLRPSLLIPALAGVLVAVIALFAVIILADDDDTRAATTTATVTTTPSSTTTAGTTSSTTTTVGSTTTSFAGGIATVTNMEPTGTPGPNLTDVRVGDHDGFVRIVFDLTGAGTPTYVVGYESPPFLATSGEPILVEGSAFLGIHLSPASTYDIDTGVATYSGDRVLEPGYAPVSQIVLVDDFEAVSYWVVGLDAQRPFSVEVLQDPLRMVVDIAK